MILQYHRDKLVPSGRFGLKHEPGYVTSRANLLCHGDAWSGHSDAEQAEDSHRGGTWRRRI